MKYTEQEFKFDHAFDLIRYIFSSVFLAPFRFTNELTRKLPYLQQDLLLQFNIWAIGINVVLIAIKILSCIKDKIFNPFAGTIPLVAYLCSLGFLVLLYIKVQTLSQPSFRKVTSEEKLMDKARKAFGEPVTEINVKKESKPNTIKINYESEEDFINDDTLEVIDISDIADNIKQGNITTGDFELDSDIAELDEALSSSLEFNYGSTENLQMTIDSLVSSQEDFELDKEVEASIACDKFNVSKIEEAMKSSEDTSASIEDMANFTMPEEYLGVTLQLDDVEI